MAILTVQRAYTARLSTHRTRAEPALVWPFDSQIGGLTLPTNNVCILSSWP